MSPSGYYTWENQATILQSPIYLSGIDMLPPANVNYVGTEMATLPNEGAVENTDTAVRLSEFNVTYHHYKNLLIRVIQISNAEIQLCNTSGGHFLFLLQSFFTCGFHHSRKKLHATTTAATTLSEAYRGALSSMPPALDKSVSMVLLNEKR